jgi:hypothetical protein
MKTQCNLTSRNALKALGFFALCTILSLMANPMYAQNNERTVTGVVNSVVLKGTASGVLTNGQGAFTFPEALKENDVLVISYMGYETAEITILEDTSFVQPYLKDIPVVILAALKTKDVVSNSSKN